MKKVLLSLSAIFTLSFGSSIDEIVNNTLSNNYDLKAIEKSIEIAKAEISIAKNWENPILNIGVNDIWFDKPFSRDKEAMQAQFIGITQAIPINDKLEILEEISKKDENISEAYLEDKKLELKSKIYEYVYSILVLEQKLKLINEYQRNIKKLENFFTKLYKYDKASQNEILTTKISFENLNLKKQSLKNMIKNLYLKLEQISYAKYENIDENIDIKKVEFSQDFLTHPKFEITKKNIEKLQEISKFESAKKYSDIKLSVAYFQRDDRFKDYANVSISIPLSFSNSEDVKSLIAKNKATLKRDELQSLEKSFEIQIKFLQNTLNNSYENYQLIKNKIIPLNEKIQKNIENYNSFEKVNPTMMIKNLNELISLELNSLDEVQNYYENYSKLIYFSQKVSNE